MASFNGLEEDIKILLVFYQLKRKDIQHKLDSLAQEKKKVEEKISALLKQSGANPYDKDWTWNQKIAFVFEHSMLGSPLSTAEIISDILSYEPELDKLSVQKSLSATLTVGADKGK